MLPTLTVIEAPDDPTTVTVGHVLDNPVFIARLWAERDRYGLEAEQEDIGFGMSNGLSREEATARVHDFPGYYCVRCHRRHLSWSAIGKRHAGPQPTSLSSASEAVA